MQPAGEQEEATRGGSLSILALTGGLRFESSREQQISSQGGPRPGIVIKEDAANARGHKAGGSVREDRGRTPQ